ncbi:cytochrome c maturation protein CcmE [Methyloglobulus sp.]|jgi:cytochrome c-type biogenesis protein CcmE|uniref:cytochrome c maturation protein CcmE n=1 Tax=Methyloglobulus sp. TaxID=2518622 RepID=UPI0017B2CFBA|nr:cytochrome c maturation protein CcmE [Methyloglobulus sp.]
MKPARKQRLILIGLMVLGASLATAFALKSFNDNLMYFFPPTDVVEGKAPKDALFRLGGMVIKGSVERPDKGMMVRFKLTDFNKEVTVEYTGILPDLFREGQGIVAHGRLNAQGVFIAEEVLAKHDENYMPPEIKATLKNPANPPAGQAQ